MTTPIQTLLVDEVLVAADEERQVIEAILSCLGAGAEAARTQAIHLLEADLRGHPSHGLQRLPLIARRIDHGLILPSAEPSFSWALPCFLSVDGERGLGPVVAYRALATLAERASVAGVAIAAVANNNHIGMLAPFVEDSAKRGFACIALTTSEALVHPYGGKRALLGTNPIAIGIPNTPEPVVLDMATSQVSMGRILAHARSGQPLPDGWALDQDGQPTTDPAAAARGSISPFGGGKGYAIGLLVELLVGLLSGCALGTDVRGTLDATAQCNKGDIFICIRPPLAQAAETASRIAAYLNEMRGSGQSAAAVLVPGDRARELRQNRLRDGIPTLRPLWDEVLTLQAELRVRGERR